MLKHRPKVAGSRPSAGRKRPSTVAPPQRGIDTRADAIRRAVARSASELLRSLAPDRSIPKVLERIGAASRVSRVQLYENEHQPDGQTSATLRYEWDAPGIAPAAQIQKAAPWGAAPRDRDWPVPHLAKGEAFGLLVRDAEEPFRGLLQMTGIKSVLLVPVFVDNKWWGQIGFDDCEHERSWSAIEIDTFKTLAELIGAAIGRARDLEQLSDASRIIESSPVLLYRISARPPHPLTYLSPNVSRFGYDAAELLKSPTHYLDLIHPGDLADVMNDISHFAQGKISEACRECRIRTADGRYVWVEDRTRALYDERHRLNAIEGILIDIDERRTAQHTLARISLSDPVTGLANRNAFMEELGRAFAAAQRGSVAFAIHYIDLDRFKDINDVLGHSKGDELLKAVAARLSVLCRADSDFVARFSGDEFAILQITVSDPSDAGAFAARILRELAEPYGLGTELHITASIGIAVFTRDVAGPEEMMKQADIALFRAKDLGRNQFHFHSEELDRATIERVMLGGDLRRALDRGELELYYQPQVDLQTRRVIGLEALTRWRHPKRGLLWPDRFIPIAEKSGTIAPLGRWVIDEVCRQILRWRATGLAPPTIAINVSAEQFKAVPEFDRALAEQLDHWNIAPHAIELELTESVLMETTREHGEIIDRLHALGVAIAIDDFGTGYSSLSYLRAYRVNHIKIAQEFIRDIQVDSGDVAIIRAALSLGRELGIEVIAEGVETRQQLDILTAAGCRYVQGFYFSEPIPASRVDEVLQQGPILPAAAAAVQGDSP